MKKIAFLFPGQGSQKVGMGQDLADAHDAARAVFDMADKATGLPISRLCFEGPMEELTSTVNLQPAVTAVNLAFLAMVQAAGIQPAVCAGHSLGEYSALCAAGVVTPEACLKLVQRRGSLMHRESTVHKGAMSAIVGMDIDAVGKIVTEAAASGVVAVANHNSAQQIVITGSPEGVAAAGELAAGQGAKAIALKVSGAWHSPLIEGAEDEFQAFLQAIAFQAPQVDVVHNVTADTASDPDRIRSLMAQQLCSPVRWFDSVNRMLADQVSVFVEIGPGRVLTGLLKKIMPKEATAAVYNVYNQKTLDKFLEEQG